MPSKGRHDNQRKGGEITIYDTPPRTLVREDKVLGMIGVAVRLMNGMWSIVEWFCVVLHGRIMELNT
jgi:ribosomal protein L16/L10AE